MPVTWDDLQLVWPAQMFAIEAQALLAAGATRRDSLGLLLDEAFYDGRALKMFNEYGAASPVAYGDDLWGTRRSARLRRATATQGYYCRDGRNGSACGLEPGDLFRGDASNLSQRLVAVINAEVGVSLLDESTVQSS